MQATLIHASYLATGRFTSYLATLPLARARGCIAHHERTKEAVRRKTKEVIRPLTAAAHLGVAAGSLGQDDLIVAVGDQLGGQLIQHRRADVPAEHRRHLGAGQADCSPSRDRAGEPVQLRVAELAGGHRLTSSDGA